jgi:hypothetical protein
MDFDQGILDIIGAFIGFISIILLLSVLVTSLVQAFQSSLRLRARNLKKGLQSIVDTHWQLDSKTSGDLALKALREAGLEIDPQLEQKVLDSFNRIWNQMETQYPELAGKIEALKSDGGGKDVLAARLAAVLTDSSQDRSAILNRYDQLSEKALIEQKKVALREGEKTINALA